MTVPVVIGRGCGIEVHCLTGFGGPIARSLYQQSGLHVFQKNLHYRLCRTLGELPNSQTIQSGLRSHYKVCGPNHKEAVSKPFLMT